ncbi:MAG: hypothetical protein KJ888_20205, partial [Gammaproteobacteria bacterium]|nr:hypothetical protein [Gammaproteobacteria bacterium]
MDTNELRQFSQTFWVNACVHTIVDEITSLDWDIVPKDGYDYDWVSDGIADVKEFFTHPNHNGEALSTVVIRSFIKDILEIDAGVLVKVFDINSYDFNELEPKSGAPMLKPIGQRKMTEIYARDGASFLKEIDKFGFCLLGNSLLETNPSIKEIQNIIIGDKVLGDDGNYHIVDDVMNREYSGTLFKIKPLGLPEISATSEHPFMTKRGWVAASQLKCNDALYSPAGKKIVSEDFNLKSLLTKSEKKNIDIFDKVQALRKKKVKWGKIGHRRLNKIFGKQCGWACAGNMPKHYNLGAMTQSKEVFEWLGWYAAEGCHSRNKVFFSLSHNEMDAAMRLREISKKLFGCNATISKTKTSLRVAVYSVIAARFVQEHIPGLAFSKRLSSWIMYAPIESQRSFMEAYVSGDGHRGRKFVQITTTSRELAWQSHNILRRLGAFARIYESAPSKNKFQGRTVKRHQQFILRYYPDEKYDGWIGITDIHSEPYMGKVYNVSVKDVDNYSTHGVITHNCKGFWQYSYQIPAHPMWFHRDEIVYCAEHSRSMSCYGYARTQAILDIVKSLHYSTLYNKRFFEETSIPDGALALLDTNEVEM